MTARLVFWTFGTSDIVYNYYLYIIHSFRGHMPLLFTIIVLVKHP